MYKHKEIEKKWQKIWEETQAFKTTENKDKKFYVLDMFPYPSGSGLHVGHPEGYTATDIIARYKRLNGYDVLHPIGWDAFGLPAEQYALNTGNHPNEFTQKNIQHFRKQLKSLGFSFDYKKEVDTTDPKYYKWTQWIFKKLYENNLAEIKEIDVNWCEELGTVLANEEVITDSEGNKVSERGGFPVVKKPMKQWVLKITEYADKLLEGLNEVEFPESLKSLQSDWIGKKEGTLINWKIDNTSEKVIEVFTTRIDTIYGVSSINIAIDHPLALELVKPEFQNEYDNLLKEFKNTSDREKIINKDKKGMFTGSYAIHPLTGQKTQIWVANYVLSNFGTGAVMTVPAHDERDFEFAEKYGIKFNSVIKSKTLPWTSDGVHLDSELINGLNIKESKKVLNNHIIKNNLGKTHTTYKMRDWIFSRQRYWGEPFPVLFDENNQIHLVDEILLLPEMENIAPSKTGESPLANNKEWVNIEINNKKYRRDTNTMPQWAGSSWYYLAYIMKQDDGSYLDLDSKEAQEKFKKWLPVDLYIGGQEHAVLHLLYSRFWHKVLYDLKLVPTSEPFYKIVNQGMILGTDGHKMSKSKGNVINPDDIVEQLGADTLRVYEMFMGPLVDTKTWSVESINGIRRWLDKIYNLFGKLQTKELIVDSNYEDLNIESFVQQTIKEVTESINLLKFNIAISKLMVFVREINKLNKINSLKIFADFAIMLSVFAPHLAEELLENIGYKNVQFLNWPEYDESKIINSSIIIAIQINGKLRGTIEKNDSDSQDEIIEKSKLVENVAKYLQDKNIKKVIYVENKIINFIVN